MSKATGIRAEDIMHREVITLRADAPISEAVQTFEEYSVHGAPVVDSGGNLVGVLSASDIAKTVHLQGHGIKMQGGNYYLADPLEDAGPDGSRRAEEFFGKDDYSPDLLGQETVGDWMNPSVISVGRYTSLEEICQVMYRETIHRVLVVENGRAVGIISTLDIVRQLAKSERSYREASN